MSCIKGGVGYQHISALCLNARPGPGLGLGETVSRNKSWVGSHTPLSTFLPRFGEYV